MWHYYYYDNKSYTYIWSNPHTAYKRLFFHILSALHLYYSSGRACCHFLWSSVRLEMILLSPCAQETSLYVIISINHGSRNRAKFMSLVCTRFQSGWGWTPQRGRVTESGGHCCNSSGVQPSILQDQQVPDHKPSGTCCRCLDGKALRCKLVTGQLQNCKLLLHS